MAWPKLFSRAHWREKENQEERRTKAYNGRGWTLLMYSNRFSCMA